MGSTLQFGRCPFRAYFNLLLLLQRIYQQQLLLHLPKITNVRMINISVVLNLERVSAGGVNNFEGARNLHQN